MATRRIVLVALILVALTSVLVEARVPSSKPEINAYDIKGAPEAVQAEEGKDVAGSVASNYATAIISNAVAKSEISAADKYMKEAEVADSPEKAAIAKKAAAQSVASALAYAFKGAAAKKAVVDATGGDATERKEVSTISSVGANANAAGEKDVASNYAAAIISNAAAKSQIAVADKYMKEAEVADSPEKAAIAKKAAAQSVTTALAYAFQGAASKKAIVAPTGGDATERKEASTISGLEANTQAAGEKDAGSKYAKAIFSRAASKVHIRAAEKHMKEATVATSPEKSADAKKAAAQNMAAAMVYAAQGVAAVAPPAADATAGVKPVKQETSSVSAPVTAKDGAGYKA